MILNHWTLLRCVHGIWDLVQRIWNWGLKWDLSQSCKWRGSTIIWLQRFLLTSLTMRWLSLRCKSRWKRSISQASASTKHLVRPASQARVSPTKVSIMVVYLLSWRLLQAHSEILGWAITYVWCSHKMWWLNCTRNRISKESQVSWLDRRLACSSNSLRSSSKPSLTLRKALGNAERAEIKSRMALEPIPQSLDLAATYRLLPLVYYHKEELQMPMV